MNYAQAADGDETRRTAVAGGSRSIEGLVRYTSKVRLRAVRAVAVVHEHAAAKERRERRASR